MDIPTDLLVGQHEGASSRGSAARIRRQALLRRYGVRYGVVAATLVLCIALCELVLWIVAPVPFHEWLVWEAQGHIRARPMPNQLIYTADGYEVRINKDGFRGPDYAYEKSPGTLRMAVFGGSAGFCYHAAGQEKTWPGALERKLKERLAMPVEVINLSLPGFDVFHSKLNYICYGRAFHPDAVVVYHTWNDMKMFRSLATKPYRSITYVPHKPLWERIARETQIGRRARNFLWTVTRREMENKYVDAEGPAEWSQPISEKAFAWERTNFRDFVVLPRSDGVLSILVSQGSLYGPGTLDVPEHRFVLSTNPGMVGMTPPLIHETILRVSSIIEEVARQEGAVFVDGYNAVPHDLKHLSDAVHLEEVGSEILAEAIADTLLADRRFLDLIERVRAEKGPSGV